MFTRQQLIDYLADFEQRRKAQTKTEFIIVFCGLAILSLLIAFMPSSWKGMLAEYIYAGAIISTLSTYWFWVNANTKRAMKEAGLVCPSCSKPIGYDVQHILLHHTCRYCNDTVYRT